MATILIVDDDPKITELVGTFLKEQGHAAVLASDTYGAMQKVREKTPDLVILDYQMPGGGAEAYQNLRRLYATENTPIIFLSAVSKYEIQYLVPEEPLVRFLEKPVDSSLLKSTVRELLDVKTPPAP